MSQALTIEPSSNVPDAYNVVNGYIMSHCLCYRWDTNGMKEKRVGRTYHHGNLRVAVLQEAERALESGGVNSISLREISRGLNVSHTARGDTLRRSRLYSMRGNPWLRAAWWNAFTRSAATEPFLREPPAAGYRGARSLRAEEPSPARPHVRRQATGPTHRLSCSMPARFPCRPESGSWPKASKPVTLSLATRRFWR